MKAKVSVLRVSPDTILQDIDRTIELARVAGFTPARPRSLRINILAPVSRRGSTPATEGTVEICAAATSGQR
jgi:hypothetical protein